MLIESVIPVVRISKCFDSVTIFRSFLWLFSLIQKWVSNFLTYCILQSRYCNKQIKGKFGIFVKFFFCLGAFKCGGYDYLSAWKILWCINVFSFSCILLNFSSFWLCLIVFVPMICPMYFYGKLWLALLWIHFWMYYWY